MYYLSEPTMNLKACIEYVGILLKYNKKSTASLTHSNTNWCCTVFMPWVDYSLSLSPLSHTQTHPHTKAYKYKQTFCLYLSIYVHFIANWVFVNDMQPRVRLLWFAYIVDFMDP